MTGGQEGQKEKMVVEHHEGWREKDPVWSSMKDCGCDSLVLSVTVTWGVSTKL